MCRETTGVIGENVSGSNSDIVVANAGIGGEQKPTAGMSAAR